MRVLLSGMVYDVAQASKGPVSFEVKLGILDRYVNCHVPSVETDVSCVIAEVCIMIIGQGHPHPVMLRRRASIQLKARCDASPVL
jgi:hypothetical protein